MRIGEVSRRTGLAASALRYYERLGLLAPPMRISGRRSYDAKALARLALIAHGRACGFRLKELTSLLTSADPKRSPRAAWKPLVASKLAELEALERQLASRRAGLKTASGCRCPSLDACGRSLLASGL
jgi:DNA-binding transcriptional MerR regulator